MKDTRLVFCLKYKDWTIEDWKRVIWTDECSVVLGHRRGAVRVWRTVLEGIEPVQSTIRHRWKGAMEMMFWGSYSYDYKGPCHCWSTEIAKEKKYANRVIEKMNEEIEPMMKEKWELENGVRRMGLRNLPGQPSEWRFTKVTGKIVREGRGGIDWWRYQQV